MSRLALVMCFVTLLSLYTAGHRQDSDIDVNDAVDDDMDENTDENDVLGSVLRSNGTNWNPNKWQFRRAGAPKGTKQKIWKEIRREVRDMKNNILPGLVGNISWMELDVKDMNRHFYSMVGDIRFIKNEVLYIKQQAHVIWENVTDTRRDHKRMNKTLWWILKNVTLVLDDVEKTTKQITNMQKNYGTIGERLDDAVDKVTEVTGFTSTIREMNSEFGQIKSSFNRGAREMTDEINVVRQIVGHLAQTILDIKQFVVQGFSQVDRDMNLVQSRILANVSDVSSKISNQGLAIAAVTDNLLEIGRSIYGFSEQVVGVWNMVVNLTEHLNEVAASIHSVDNHINEFGAKITNVDNQVVDIQRQMKNMGNQLSIAATQFVGFATNVDRNFDKVNLHLGNVHDGIISNVSSVKGDLDEMKGQLREIRQVIAEKCEAACKDPSSPHTDRNQIFEIHDSEVPHDVTSPSWPHWTNGGAVTPTVSNGRPPSYPPSPPLGPGHPPNGDGSWPSQAPGHPPNGDSFWPHQAPGYPQNDELPRPPQAPGHPPNGDSSWPPQAPGYPQNGELPRPPQAPGHPPNGDGSWPSQAPGHPPNGDSFWPTEAPGYPQNGEFPRPPQAPDHPPNGDSSWPPHAPGYPQNGELPRPPQAPGYPQNGELPRPPQAPGHPPNGDSSWLPQAPGYPQNGDGSWPSQAPGHPPNGDSFWPTQAPGYPQHGELPRPPQAPGHPPNGDSSWPPHAPGYPQNGELPRPPQAPGYPQNGELPKPPQAPGHPPNGDSSWPPQAPGYPQNGELPRPPQAPGHPPNGEYPYPGVHPTNGYSPTSTPSYQPTTVWQSTPVWQPTSGYTTTTVYPPTPMPGYPPIYPSPQPPPYPSLYPPAYPTTVSPFSPTHPYPPITTYPPPYPTTHYPQVPGYPSSPQIPGYPPITPSHQPPGYPPSTIYPSPAYPTGPIYPGYPQFPTLDSTTGIGMPASESPDHRLPGFPSTSRPMWPPGPPENGAQSPIRLPLGPAGPGLPIGCGNEFTGHCACICPCDCACPTIEARAIALTKSRFHKFWDIKPETDKNGLQKECHCLCTCPCPAWITNQPGEVGRPMPPPWEPPPVQLPSGNGNPWPPFIPLSPTQVPLPPGAHPRPNDSVFIDLIGQFIREMAQMRVEMANVASKITLDYDSIKKFFIDELGRSLGLVLQELRNLFNVNSKLHEQAKELIQALQTQLRQAMEKAAYSLEAIAVNILNFHREVTTMLSPSRPVSDRRPAFIPIMARPPPQRPALQPPEFTPPGRIPFYAPSRPQGHPDGRPQLLPISRPSIQPPPLSPNYPPAQNVARPRDELLTRPPERPQSQPPKQYPAQSPAQLPRQGEGSPGRPSMKYDLISHPGGNFQWPMGRKEAHEAAATTTQVNTSSEKARRMFLDHNEDETKTRDSRISAEDNKNKNEKGCVVNEKSVGVMPHSPTLIAGKDFVFSDIEDETGNEEYNDPVRVNFPYDVDGMTKRIIEMPNTEIALPEKDLNIIDTSMDPFMFHNLLQDHINDQLMNAIQPGSSYLAKGKRFPHKRWYGRSRNRYKLLPRPMLPMIPGLPFIQPPVRLRPQIPFVRLPNALAIRPPPMPNLFGQLPPGMMVSAMNSSPYSVSYNDGQGTSWNVNVNRRKYSGIKEESYQEHENQIEDNPRNGEKKDEKEKNNENDDEHREQQNQNNNDEIEETTESTEHSQT